MATTTGKIAEVLFESVLESYETQMSLMNMCEVFTPGSGDMQNAGNVVWRPVEQHAAVIDGWDLTGQEQDIIEETYPAILGTPKNDFVIERADDLRDMGFWERRGVQSGKKQASELNKQLAVLVKNTGSMFYRSNATNGYEFIGEAQTLYNERQLPTDRYFMMNDRDQLVYASDLASRQTLDGRAESAYATGMIGRDVADFDVYGASFLPNLVGGADPAATVTGAQSFKPDGGSVNTSTGVVTNVDYRTADIPVSASGGYNVGDKVSFANSGTTVKAVGLDDKTDTNQAMTFTIVAKPDSTTITVYPKPIAFDDTALSDIEKQYANIDTTIGNSATVNRLNTDVNAKTNIFWQRDSVEITAGDAPLELLNEFGGMKVISSTLKNGLRMYMVYDGNINNLTFTFRLFTWYGLTNKNPSANGVAVRF